MKPSAQAARSVPSPRRIRLPGVELHVSEAGDGPPLVLVHGWPQHGGMWDPLVSELAGDYRVLVPDLRGFGRSEAPPGGYDKHTLAADILALIDAESLERATIIGHDWGGWIAWLLALEHPERIDRFVSIDVPPPWGINASPASLARQLLYGSYQLAIASPILGERLVRSRRAVRSFINAGATASLNPEAVDDYARLTSEPASARASVALYRTFLAHELPAVARGTYTTKELTVPGMVIMGGDSAITKMAGIPRDGDRLTVKVIANVGHFLVDEAADQVLALLRPFLARGST